MPAEVMGGRTACARETAAVWESSAGSRRVVGFRRNSRAASCGFSSKRLTSSSRWWTTSSCWSSTASEDDLYVKLYPNCRDTVTKGDEIDGALPSALSIGLSADQTKFSVTRASAGVLGSPPLGDLYKDYQGTHVWGCNGGTRNLFRDPSTSGRAGSTTGCLLGSR